MSSPSRYLVLVRSLTVWLLWSTHTAYRADRFAFDAKANARTARLVQSMRVLKGPPAPYFGGASSRGFQVDAHCLAASILFLEIKSTNLAPLNKQIQSVLFIGFVINFVD